MARTCTICSHQSKEDIDKLLVANSLSLREISGQFGVRKSALERHKANHLPALLVKAQEAEEVAQADDLLTMLHSLRKEARSIKDKAEAAGDFKTALTGIRELVRIIELLAKLKGELDERPQVNVLIASPEWLSLRIAILRALEPFPEARLAVVEALNARTS